MEFKIIKAFVISLVLMGCSEKEIKVKDDDSWIKIDKHHAFINIDTSDFNSKKTAELHYSGLEYYKMEKY